MDMTFQDYATKAIKRMNFKGDSELAQALNLTKASISALQNNKTLPSEETIIKVAELAGLPIDIALIDLSIWRAKKQKNSQLERNWQIIKHMCQK